jgi:hypothetical protein
MKKVILYIPGSHGSFLKFLFDCYDQNRIPEFNTGETGNWHPMRDIETNNVCLDMAYDGHVQQYRQMDPQKQEFRVVFDTHEEFCYILQCVVDRGASMSHRSGIGLLEADMEEYQADYGVHTNYKKMIKDFYGYDGATVPRFVLRNLFILIFMTHFNHVCWKLNDDFKKHGKNLIHIEEILDYESLKERLDVVFGKSLDFVSIHKHLLENNNPYSQMLKVRKIIDAVEAGKDMPIDGLNTISEAYICFYFEKKHYSINFNLSNDFFKSTKELKMYIDHYPKYMTRPNNLFLEHWRIYKDAE